MSSVMNHQMITYFLQYGVPHAMIAILEEQRITEEDLQTIDRDDVEHLFKNEYGFTFRHRKRFWNTLQNFHLTNKQNDVSCIPHEVETPDIYEVIDEEPPNYHLTQDYAQLSSSNMPLPTDIYDYPNSNTPKNMFAESSSETNVNHIRVATIPLSTNHQVIECIKSSTSAEFLFEHPVELPIFSAKVMKAFEQNDIDSEWQTLVRELAEWVSSKKLSPLKKRENQAIGQTIYKCYPSIGKDGFRPWSYLCKCITQRVRKTKKQRRLLNTHK